ncbi:MAG: DUF1570 domain-containing protein [Candidatus Omnitrophica bacterium]|nr:DUF1570 domain-containing protein [Candidatus Omnitrophota bacterium]
MRTFLLLLAVVMLAAGGASWYLRAHPEHSPLDALQQHVQLPDQVRALLQRTQQRFSTTPELATPSQPPASSFQPPASTPASSSSTLVPPVTTNQVTLYLTNGGAMTGELLKETSEEVILRFDYGDVGFRRDEIERVEKGAASLSGDGILMPWEHEHENIPWDYQHEVVVKLMKGTVIDAKITQVTDTDIVLAQELPGGGQMEQTIARKDVEALLFRPAQNERSTAIKKNLQTIFPQMSWDDEGLFTIVSDSAPPDIKKYRQVIREVATDWYLTFFPLVKDRAPTVQAYIVIFENQDAYIEYALTDGVPGWFAVGYFQPEDEVLYCYNMVGEQFSELLSEIYLGRFRRARDRSTAAYKGSQYEDTLEGLWSEFLRKLESGHAMVRQAYGQLGNEILRHEMTHAMFHDWQLQHIVLSKMSEADQAKAQQKREFLKAGTVEEKRKLLEAMFATENEDQITDLQAANSWFSEGLAGYMEPSPVGGTNVLRLPDAQKARGAGQILPLEFLHAFRMGSFAGMANQSALYAYAQSWAFSHFLMVRYRSGFMTYLDRLARQPPNDGEDTLPWLMEALGKEQRALEQEFLTYLDQFPLEDPFWLKRKQAILDLQNELNALLQRL